MEDHELSPLLRQAYDGADPEVQPSPFLRERTLRALRNRGIVARADARRSGWLAAVAAAAAAAGVLLGWQLADRGAPGAGETVATSAAPAGLEGALEEVQRTGTAHARALERLVESLDRVDASTLAGAQEVYLAAERARYDDSAILLAGRAAAADEEPPPTAAGGPRLIWF